MIRNYAVYVGSSLGFGTEPICTCMATCSVSGENLLRLSALPAVLVWVLTLQSAPRNLVRIHWASRKNGG